jgi:hypothetical protein
MKLTSRPSLLDVAPALAREWDQSKNGDLTPADVTQGSARKVWWRCSRDRSHVWCAKVNHRAGRGDGCPVCSGRVATVTTCLATLHPHLAAAWHSAKNGDISPAQILPGSQKRVWWQCSKNASHIWAATVASRVYQGAGCPMCAGRVATPETSLTALHPDVVIEWHPTKNGAVRPESLTAASHRTVWWRCSKDGTHEWRARVAHRTQDASGCPMCANQVVTQATSLQARYPDLAREWHPTKNRALSPNDVVPGSGRRVWWRCSLNRHHQWVADVRARARKGRGWPMCRVAHKTKQKQKRRGAGLRAPTLT